MSYEDGKKLKIFTGNANPELAKEIADYLGLELGKAFVGKFNNGEIQVMIDERIIAETIVYLMLKKFFRSILVMIIYYVGRHGKLDIGWDMILSLTWMT